MAFGDEGLGLNGKELSMGQLAALLRSAAQNVDPAVDSRLRTAAQVGVGHVKRSIQGMHAVDTGTMLNSTTAENVGLNTVLIGPTVDYATFVALGTSRMPARPFHIVAAQKLAADLPLIFKDVAE